jgi:hypothetical protein
MTDSFAQSSVSSQLWEEYAAQRALFETQPPLVQRFLEAQARQLAEALTHPERVSRARFTLPDRVVIEAQSKPVPIAPEGREQLAGGLIDQLTRGDVRTALRQRLVELEQWPDRAIAVGAGLVRYATVAHMVHNMLPAGRSVTYVAAEGEEIPSIPVGSDLEPASAITAATDAIAEQETLEVEPDRGELIVPFVPAARKFYLPRWVAFDDKGQLLVKSANEAEAHIGSMQRFLGILHMAVSLAPYIVADEDYQRKRYGMLGQLVNQGRALARYETEEIIRTIKQRAAAQDLNRGLSLSLPYFDDQALEMKLHDFEIIPAGRIMFVPAFVVRAAREEQAKVVQDTRLSHSTRVHLLTELKTLELAFETAPRSAVAVR